MQTRQLSMVRSVERAEFVHRFGPGPLTQEMNQRPFFRRPEQCDDLLFAKRLAKKALRYMIEACENQRVGLGERPIQIENHAGNMNHYGILITCVNQKKITRKAANINERLLAIRDSS